MTTEQPEALRIADLFEVFGTNELAKKAGKRNNVLKTPSR